VRPGALLEGLRGMVGGVRRRFFPTRLDRILAVPGWTQKVQLRYLMTKARALPDRSVIVELGVWQGRSLLALAEACRGTSRRVFAIDPWTDYDEGGGPVASRLGRWGLSSFEEVYERFRANCRDLGLEPWIVTVRAPSLAAARRWAHGPIALLFIDANHAYEAVTADLETWTPLVRPGGLICGDDWDWQSVRQAVSEFITRYPAARLQLPCNNTWAFEVPGA
jgi:predicted O-methyltransferase YrrM